MPFKFKKDLKDIVASKVLAAEHVFINVPKKMNDDLSAFYNPNAAKWYWFDITFQIKLLNFQITFFVIENGLKI